MSCRDNRSAKQNEALYASAGFGRNLRHSERAAADAHRAPEARPAPLQEDSARNSARCA